MENQPAVSLGLLVPLPRRVKTLNSQHVKLIRRQSVPCICFQVAADITL